MSKVKILLGLILLSGVGIGAIYYLDPGLIGLAPVPPEVHHLVGNGGPAAHPGLALNAEHPLGGGGAKPDASLSLSQPSATNAPSAASGASASLSLNPSPAVTAATLPHVVAGQSVADAGHGAVGADPKPDVSAPAEPASSGLSLSSAPASASSAGATSDPASPSGVSVSTPGPLANIVPTPPDLGSPDVPTSHKLAELNEMDALLQKKKSIADAQKAIAQSELDTYKAEQEAKAMEKAAANGSAGGHDGTVVKGADAAPAPKPPILAGASLVVTAPDAHKGWVGTLLMNGQGLQVHAGDTIGDIHVVSVHQDSVLLAGEGQTRLLMLGAAAADAAPPAASHDSASALPAGFVIPKPGQPMRPILMPSGQAPRNPDTPASQQGSGNSGGGSGR